jgi:integrative and conjugative element protein (TIGR02256 family)
MGYWVEPCIELRITKMIGPGLNAFHGATSFYPDYDWQEEQIAEIYRTTGRVETYLGDWHFHPFGSDRLSCKS